MMTNKEYVEYEKEVINEATHAKKFSFKLFVKLVSLNHNRPTI